MGAKNPPIPRVIHHFYTLGRLENWGYLSLAIEFYGSLASQKYEGQAYTSDITKRWKNTWFFIKVKKEEREERAVADALRRCRSPSLPLAVVSHLCRRHCRERNEEKRLPSPRTSLAITAAHRRLATPLPVTAAVAESTHLFLRFASYLSQSGCILWRLPFMLSSSKFNQSISFILTVYLL
ncbi:hypothetical protein LWI29_011710 [Acer saccharum]|uniref:Uncharacterized protein n=1 Tax=Acer saccharum TaxID=4024 RepID=A0AA39W8D4_ACESA|nr:hypothetical protein LWI29_011710 [Acer saccharum]